MLLKPCRDVYDRMLANLRGPHSKEEKTGMPEQDFLGRWYPKWFNLHVKFNYQPHQVGFLARDKSLLNCTRMSTDYIKEVKIVHFSAVPKPRDKIFSNLHHTMDERKFLYDIMFTKYMAMFGKERSRSLRYVDEFREMTEFLPIAFKLRDDTINGGLDWFKFYRLMVESLKSQQWRTSCGELRDFKALLEATLGRKYSEVLPGHNQNAPVKNLPQGMGCQSENNKVFLEVANGDQELAEGLSRLASPCLVGDAAYRSALHTWVELEKLKEELKRKQDALYQEVRGLWQDNRGCSKRREVIGAPPETRKRMRY